MSSSPHNPAPADTHGRPESATRILELLGPEELSYVMQAMPEGLQDLTDRLLCAPTENEFRRTLSAARAAYALTSIDRKRELIRRISATLPPNALGQLGRLLDITCEPVRDDPPDVYIEASRLRHLLVGHELEIISALGLELSQQLTELVQQPTEDSFNRAATMFACELAANPVRARAAARILGPVPTLVALQRITKTPAAFGAIAGSLISTSMVQRRTQTERRLRLVRKSILRGVTGGAIGLLAAPPLLASAGALSPFLVHVAPHITPELIDKLLELLRRSQRDLIASMESLSAPGLP